MVGDFGQFESLNYCRRQFCNIIDLPILRSVVDVSDTSYGFRFVVY